VVIEAFKNAFARFRDDNLTDWAAALTYYGLLSLFPGLIALVSIFGLLGDPQATSRTIGETIEELGPNSPASELIGPVRSIASHRATAGLGFVLGLALALWSASGYLAAFGRASDIVYGKQATEPAWKLRGRQVGIALVLVLLAGLLVLGLVLSGPIVDAFADSIGVGSAGVTTWDLLKWPLMAAAFVAMVSIVYSTAHAESVRDVTWFTPGALFAIAAWAIASAAFGLYVAEFGSYDETYGTLGGLVALLVWLWITNLAILFGHTLNAQLERDDPRTPRRSSR
jgi:membrane protein